VAAEAAGVEDREKLYSAVGRSLHTNEGSSWVKDVGEEVVEVEVEVGWVDMGSQRGKAPLQVVWCCRSQPAAEAADPVFARKIAAVGEVASSRDRNWMVGARQAAAAVVVVEVVVEVEKCGRE
jgi:hypothetical protein